MGVTVYALMAGWCAWMGGRPCQLKRVRAFIAPPDASPLPPARPIALLSPPPPKNDHQHKCNPLRPSKHRLSMAFHSFRPRRHTDSFGKANETRRRTQESSQGRFINLQSRRKDKSLHGYSSSLHCGAIFPSFLHEEINASRRMC